MDRGWSHGRGSWTNSRGWAAQEKPVPAGDSWSHQSWMVMSAGGVQQGHAGTPCWLKTLLRSARQTVIQADSLDEDITMGNLTLIHMKEQAAQPKYRTQARAHAGMAGNELAEFC